MSALDKKIIAASLNKKGFVEDSKKDHSYFYFYVDGKKTHIFTKISHGSGRDIDDSLQNLMKRQLKLGSKRQFVDLVNCPLTKEGYLQFLIDNNVI